MKNTFIQLLWCDTTGMLSLNYDIIEKYLL
uniref:Uncharacterized protein n=1 Tax=Candidatus Kentrum sp. FM TaxID=2126340 RepID=A0A450VUK7_9GAMM|nr:MAG: hypothetical protein BECKFM1743A_GA0114220_100067 [Candidatus Kentron sp. FM]VFJ43905.1 MAG: hypothetical protein BECKFM1743C_GA0114222_1000514 [Candidatus Kentron sp. FM]VFK08457.1 MAG: hypothetical protein BECKFM1743B_GA0114221_100704 [Candidatus Kentron sp. FM]